MIAGILLAAGSSARFGSPKLLHEVGGKPLVCYTLQACTASLLPTTHIVVADPPAFLQAVQPHLELDERLVVVHNDHAERGMMSSLKVGLKALPGSCDGAMVLLADMPLVTAQVIDDLYRTFERRDDIVIPICDGIRRNPRVIPRRLFGEFLAMEDGMRGSAVIETHADEVVEVETGNRVTFLDVDDPRDLAEVERLLAH